MTTMTRFLLRSNNVCGYQTCSSLCHQQRPPLFRNRCFLCVSNNVLWSLRTLISISWSPMRKNSARPSTKPGNPTNTKMALAIPTEINLHHLHYLHQYICWMHNPTAIIMTHMVVWTDEWLLHNTSLSLLHLCSCITYRVAISAAHAYPSLNPLLSISLLVFA